MNDIRVLRRLKTQGLVAATCLGATLLLSNDAHVATKPTLSAGDLAGSWTYERGGRKATVTFAPDGTFTRSVPPPLNGPLKGRWQLNRNALIWAYMLSDAERARGEDPLVVDIITDASPDRLTLRGQTDSIITTLSREKPPAGPRAGPASSGGSLLPALGAVIAVVAGLMGGAYLNLRSRLRDRQATPVRQSRADIHNIVVRDPATGLEPLHFIVTVEQLERAKNAVLDTFAAVRSSHGDSSEFGGEVLFVVYSPATPGAELARMKPSSTNASRATT